MFLAFAAGVFVFNLSAAPLNLALPPFWCLTVTLNRPLCSFFLHELSYQLLCQLLDELLPSYMAAGALLEEDVGIDPGRVEDVVKCIGHQQPAKI